MQSSVKKIVLLIICILCVFIVHAQEKNSCDSTYLQNATNIATADPCLLAGANYILEHPLIGNSKLYYNYMGFILEWMDKTPDFSFSLNSKVLELCKDDNLSLFNVYLTCLAKAAIETKKNYVPVAIKLFVAYLEKPENKVKRTSKIKKMIADVQEDKLEKYI